MIRLNSWQETRGAVFAGQNLFYDLQLDQYEIGDFCYLFLKINSRGILLPKHHVLTPRLFWSLWHCFLYRLDSIDAVLRRYQNLGLWMIPLGEEYQVPPAPSDIIEEAPKSFCGYRSTFSVPLLKVNYPVCSAFS